MLQRLQRFTLPAALAAVVGFGPVVPAQEPSAEPEASEKQEKAAPRGRLATEGEKLTVLEALKRLKTKLPESVDLGELRVIEGSALKPCSIPLLPLQPTAKGSIRSVDPPPGPRKMLEVDPPAPSCDDY